MSKPRKSSIDGARRTTKAHIPFRADDLTHGKKTGFNVREVDRRSDGFEKFDDVLNQADAFTPPHMRGRRRNYNRELTPPDEDEFDENGEMSMDIDDSAPNVYFNNAPRPSAPSSANRSAATGLSSNRSSYIDFDSIPSPRPSTSSQRMRSQANGSGGVTPLGRKKSNLSHQTVVPSSPEDSESDNEPLPDPPPGDDFDMGYDFGGYGNDRPAVESSSPVAARTSFTEIAQDDTDPPPMDDIRISSPPVRIEKKKKPTRQKESVAEEEMALEEEIERGLRELDDNTDAEGEEEQDSKGNQSSKSQKRTRSEEQALKEKKKPENQENIMPNGVRRGTRARYKPLDWWRCEKVVYGRRESGTSMVPVIKGIIRIPKEPTGPLGSKGKRTRRSRSKAPQGDDEEEEDVVVFNPEEGWDDKTDPTGVVLDYHSGKEVQRRLVFTAKMITPEPAMNNEFLYQKIFGDGDFIAAGELIVPVNGRKPSKASRDNTYIFYLIEGAINLKVHRTSFVIASGGMFLIPRGNTYYIENISQRPAKLFFAQARQVNVDEEMPLLPVVRAAPHSGGGGGRTKSVGPGTGGPTSGKSSSLARSSSVAITGASSGDKEKKSAKRAVSLSK
ncbi:uncharacterized protein FOMMEDRAFT_86864 [Fomitiporia mediterranea MF3/22]|uniref:uncharacterized protein n=1 Tax=Fomitiporia mediterranea (strain MF3/22) TaxID=694068 RepID=UPI00044096AC|nr:uncharacterized protein FOMMEDRAFT_86864 [Fomitiporia mediterranea MF3/22]EJD02264.1 hypothetical protein FOMMEDRAFT_86864 [Fomitiporia mediterranea MF3/22]